MHTKRSFPLQFIDQILEILVGHAFYYFLDSYLGYNQIEIALEDKKKNHLHLSFQHICLSKDDVWII